MVLVGEVRIVFLDSILKKSLVEGDSQRIVWKLENFKALSLKHRGKVGHLPFGDNEELVDEVSSNKDDTEKFFKHNIIEQAMKF